MAKRRFKIIDLLLPGEIHIFKHLNEQVDIFVETCEKFNEMVKHIESMSHAERKKYVEAIKKLEMKGDEKERGIIEELEEVFILPLDREDIHSIVSDIDNATDLVCTTSKMIHTHDIRKKDKYIAEFSKITLECAKDLKKLVNSIEKRNGSTEIIAKINRCEKEADELFDKAMTELFKGKDPIELLRRKDIYEMMEEVVDKMDSISKVIRGVLVKQG